MNTLTKYFSLIALSVLLSGCGVFDYVVEKTKGTVEYVFPAGSKLAWDSFSIAAAADANLNSPIAVDVVFLKDEASFNLVAALAADKWFITRVDLQKTFPKSLSYRSFELVPGQTLLMPESEFSSIRTAAVVLFANYLTPGEHRMRADQLKGDVLVQLGPQTFTLNGQTK